MDLNFDGSIDTWVYRDPSGGVRRRENDYDRDGRIDEIAIFKAGELTEKHRATTLGGRLDTWHYFREGKLARTERDSDGDSVVDQWWEYPVADRADCPLIHADVDGDGKPDPGVSVDVCKEHTGFVPPSLDNGQRGGFDFAGPAGALPTEVEQKDSSDLKDPKTPAKPEGPAAAPPGTPP